jgi:TorA maturation chaperone TorD
VQNKINSDNGNLLKGYNLLLYFAGSMIMYEPTEECVTDFFSDGIMKKMPVASSNPRFMQAASVLREICTDREGCRKSLISDYNRLFSSDGPMLAIPRKSAYPMYSNGGSNGDVNEFYNSYGWRSISRAKVPDDHLGLELLFLTKLIDKYLQLDDEPCRFEMKKEISRFIGDHIITWIPEWNRKMQKNAESVYYRGIANLVHASIEDLYQIFEDQRKP